MILASALPSSTLCGRRGEGGGGRGRRGAGRRGAEGKGGGKRRGEEGSGEGGSGEEGGGDRRGVDGRGGERNTQYAEREAMCIRCVTEMHTYNCNLNVHVVVKEATLWVEGVSEPHPHWSYELMSQITP